MPAETETAEPEFEGDVMPFLSVWYEYRCPEHGARGLASFPCGAAGIPFGVTDAEGVQCLLRTVEHVCRAAVTTIVITADLGDDEQ